MYLILFALLQLEPRQQRITRPPELNHILRGNFFTRTLWDHCVMGGFFFFFFLFIYLFLYFHLYIYFDFLPNHGEILIVVSPRAKLNLSPRVLGSTSLLCLDHTCNPLK